MVSNCKPGSPEHPLQAGIWVKRKREKFLLVEPGLGLGLRFE